MLSYLTLSCEWNNCHLMSHADSQHTLKAGPEVRARRPFLEGAMELGRPPVAGAQVKGQAACDYGSCPPQSCPAVKSGTGIPKDRINLPENEVRDDVFFPQ